MKKRHLFHWSLCGAFLLATGCAVEQKVPSAWIPAGNEMERVVDPETGKTVVYLTSGQSLDTHFHFHNGSWGTINGTTYLFFSSSRERPAAAGKTVPGERQIMAANVETGDLYYLATIPNENPESSSQWSFRPYFASYNDVAKTIFFWDKQRRMIYPYTIRGKNGKNSGYIAVSDFDRDLDLLSTRIVLRCPTNEALNHVEINPANKEVFFYKRHHEKRPNGSFGRASLYIKNLAEPESEDFFVNSTNQTIDHMVWGESGRHIYWDNNAGDLWRLDYPSCKTKIVGSGGNIHNQLSPDEKLWVYDLRKDPPCFAEQIDGFKIESWKGSIWIHDMGSNTSARYANIIWGSPHPKHPHARFSPDGSMISFTTGMDNENSRVAIMRVAEEQRWTYEQMDFIEPAACGVRERGGGTGQPGFGADKPCCGVPARLLGNRARPGAQPHRGLERLASHHPDIPVDRHQRI